MKNSKSIKYNRPLITYIKHIYIYIYIYIYTQNNPPKISKTNNPIR